MSDSCKTPAQVAASIRWRLRRGGDAEHAQDVQWFFKEEIKSHGWRTAALRREARRQRREIVELHGLDFLVQVADELFCSPVLEEKNFAVFLLEKLTDKLGDEEFRLLESWLLRIASWADHDALVYYLIGNMIVAKPSRKSAVFRWARSRDRWHRRAACVALIPGTRRRMFFTEIVRLSDFLLADEDDMVRKGLGWLLRETAKADAQKTIPHLIQIRGRAPRLVLRTACETLSAANKKKILE